MNTPPVTYRVDDDGVGWIVFDDPNGRANVFNPAVLAAFEVSLTQAIQQPPVALVIMSAKDRIFIAGADLKWVGALPTPEAAAEFSRHGQKLFQRLADASFPVVGAIHGACAGGGFELALACHWRIASDAPSTQIGLPETGLGAIPGWGGTVRLPRLIGAKAALEHMLKGQLVSANDAQSAGMVHEVVPAAELQARAKAAALRLAREGLPRPKAPEEPTESYFAGLRETVAAKNSGGEPALLAVIDVVQRSLRLPIAGALEIEARAFGRVTASDTCRNLIHVFFLREAAKKRTLAGWFPADAGRPIAIQEVGVVGAGIMGSGIAHWLAARGFTVVMRDVQPGPVAQGLGVIRNLFDEAVKRGRMPAGEANSALSRIATTTGWGGFEACDLVIEAIVENAAAKRALFSELAGVVRPDALLASNTSALPIEEIAGHIPNSARTLGIHFFNPVSRMSLVELIVGQHTSAATAESALALVKALGKSPVICRSSPGFLVTRVLFFYLNTAVRLWEQGAGTAEIDAAMRDFGWPMGPLRLIDEVGVDVTDFIFGEMQHYFPARFQRTTACTRMLAAGMKGRKNGASRGFYRYEGKMELINDRETLPLLSQRATSRQPIGGRDIVQHLMQVMVDEARRCLEEGVVKSPDDVDFALLSGAGFPAFRGGLMRWAESVKT